MPDRIVTKQATKHRNIKLSELEELQSSCVAMINGKDGTITIGSSEIAGPDSEF